MNTHFLRAEWNNLIIANYVVPKELLLPYLPFKAELDLFEGEAYLSLVGFMFLNTKILGFSVPFHNNFEEVNIRFYVKYNSHGNWKRGVVFIKEIVPSQTVSFIANMVYGEKYATMKMKHYHGETEGFLETGYEWENKNKWNKLTTKTSKKSSSIIQGSLEEFFADHYWGYTKSSDTKTYEYHVEHPIWETLKVVEYLVDCDFGLLYGDEFSFLSAQQPRSVVMTKGSEIKVYHKRVLE